MRKRISYMDMMEYLQEKEEENARLARNQRILGDVSDAYKRLKANKVKQGKYLRYPEAKEYYCLGMSTLKKVAKEAGAIIHLGKIALVDTEIMDKYIDSFRE